MLQLPPPLLIVLCVNGCCLYRECSMSPSQGRMMPTRDDIKTIVSTLLQIGSTSSLTSTRRRHCRYHRWCPVISYAVIPLLERGVIVRGYAGRSRLGNPDTVTVCHTHHASSATTAEDIIAACACDRTKTLMCPYPSPSLMAHRCLLFNRCRAA